MCEDTPAADQQYRVLTVTATGAAREVKGPFKLEVETLDADGNQAVKYQADAILFQTSPVIEHTLRFVHQHSDLVLMSPSGTKEKCFRGENRTIYLTKDDELPLGTVEYVRYGSQRINAWGDNRLVMINPTVVK